MFETADCAGWKRIVPVDNLCVMLKICGNAWRWLLLLFVPLVNIYALYRLHAGVARAFGRGIGLGLAFLGFGSDRYRRSGGIA